MTDSESTTSGPHSRIDTCDAREQFTAALFDQLWNRYRARVSYVRTYETLIAERGATFVNDHVAFRTFGCQSPLTGTSSISRIFEALGYEAAGIYRFPDKHLSAMHYQHANADFPKLFISELRTWELSDQAQDVIASTVRTHRPPLGMDRLARLSRLGGLPKTLVIEPALLNEVLREFHELPWAVPRKADLERLNAESQYAAWVLVHGYNVNHFTSLINSHGVPELNDIEKTAAALEAAGVPMKSEIEGQPGSKLRQTATAAVEIDVPVLVDDQETSTLWSYAYFELAERGQVVDPFTGATERFEGFLGPQATQLFEMTRRA